MIIQLYQVAQDWSREEPKLVTGDGQLIKEARHLFTSAMHNLVIIPPIHPPVTFFCRVWGEKIRSCICINSSNASVYQARTAKGIWLHEGLVYWYVQVSEDSQV